MPEPQAAPPQWWLLQDGAPAGPFPHAQVAAQLASRHLSWQTLASPVGTTQWRPLRDWDCFDHHPSFTFRDSGKGSQDLDTSAARTPALPDMAYWLVNYGLFVSPVVWLINRASCVAGLGSGAPVELLISVLVSVLTLVSTGLLFGGALYLKKGKRSGARLMITGFSVDMALMLLFVLAVLAAAQDPATGAAEPAPPFGVGETALCAVSFAGWIFEVFGLVWLLSRGQALPLR